MTTPKKPDQKRIGPMSGAGNRDQELLQGVNAKARRRPDGSQDDSAGDEGAYAGDPNGAAFPTGPEAFPEQSDG